MNTFLPYLDFIECAKCLDNKRLFKQVVEAKQIIDILTTGKTKDGRDYPLSMKHHPIVKAWKGYESELRHYFNCCLDITLFRGIKTKMNFYILERKGTPKWLTNKVCQMYQAHLLRKDPFWYQFKVDPIIPFEWSLIKGGMF